MKSNVSDYLELLDLIYIDATSKCTADVSDLRDLHVMRSRVEDEGISFLTITLPNFAKDFERSLANGKIDSTLFRGFARVSGGSIPALLQGMISQIFDRETGEFINDVNPQRKVRGSTNDIPTCVESIRQICLSFKKLELECTPERVTRTFAEFVNTEHSLSEFALEDQERSKFLVVSDMLWNNLVADFSASNCVPRHGPGATAERISGNQKYIWRSWHDRLEPYFPIISNGYPLGIVDDPGGLDITTIVQETDEQPVRVVTVPKTLKGPRIIAIEPCCQQYVQQGIRNYLYKEIESYWLTAGHVNFTDQTINQKIAMSSSSTGRLATIDLSEASDRVPLDLAIEMFRTNTEMYECVLACRSTRAKLPNGKIISPLRKFASMGSALCFPVEAMYFYTICVVALLDCQKLSYTHRNIFNVSRDVYVYGDDIVVPSTNAVAVLERLQKYHCKVNVAKTFVTGKFRESCGIDAFDGMDVTPVYVRQACPKNRQQASEAISFLATANQLYKKGYWKTAFFMFNKLEEVMGFIPYIHEGSEALGRISFLVQNSISKLLWQEPKRSRWNSDLQRLEIRAHVPRPVYRTDSLNGYAALAKSLANLEASSDATIRTGTDLERSALHGAVTLKRRWVTPY